MQEYGGRGQPGSALSGFGMWLIFQYQAVTCCVIVERCTGSSVTALESEAASIV